nr:MAG TPA: hypothetical protein [Caudoviricetes sp.]
MGQFFHLYYITIFQKKSIKKIISPFVATIATLRKLSINSIFNYIKIVKKIKLRCVLHLFLYRFKERK